MKLTVVIVSYNVKYYLAQCLRSLRRSLVGIDAEVFVVDNSSSDGSVEYVKSLFPDIKVISSSRNLGFAKANNLAISQSNSEYVLLLNPDTMVGETTIKDVISFADTHRRCGGIGVRMLRDNGSDALESRRGIPTPMTAFYKIVGLCSKFPKSARFAHYYMGDIPWGEPSRIEVMSGAFCFLRRDSLDNVGLLDEDFFMYGEDIDLSYRLVKGGYEIWYVPARILHYKGESTEKSSFRYVHTFYNAMLIFFRKHYGSASFLITIPVKMAILFKALTSLAGMNWRNMRRSLGVASRASVGAERLFVLLGTPETLEAMSTIVRNNGLKFTKVVADERMRPEGHHSLELAAGHDVCVVYDTGAYSYDSILCLLSEGVHTNVTLGTFDMDSKMIITCDSVIK